METQQCVQLVMYLMLGLILLSFPVKLEGSHGLSVDDSGGPDSISSLQCSQEYISKSYFGKHVSFLDSDFHGYLVHELPLGLCKALPRSLDSVVKVSVFQRNLIGEGSHRSLVSPIKFHLQEGISELPEHFCQAVVVEKLPSGVFADPFEIQHLVQRGVFVDAAVFGDTNLELPSALSNRSVVEIHMDLGHNILSRHRKVLEVNIVLPLHARYPPLGVSGYSKVQMNAPDIFMRCTTEEKSRHENCLWMTTAEDAGSNNGVLVWRIPSGNKEHSGIVSTVTFISALLSAFLIILTAICTPHVHLSESIKQS